MAPAMHHHSPSGLTIHRDNHWHARASPLPWSQAPQQLPCSACHARPACQRQPRHAARAYNTTRGRDEDSFLSLGSHAQAACPARVTRVSYLSRGGCHAQAARPAHVTCLSRGEGGHAQSACPPCVTRMSCVSRGAGWQAVPLTPTAFRHHSLSFCYRAQGRDQHAWHHPLPGTPLLSPRSSHPPPRIRRRPAALSPRVWAIACRLPISSCQTQPQPCQTQPCQPKRQTTPPRTTSHLSVQCLTTRPQLQRLPAYNAQGVTCRAAAISGVEGQEHKKKRQKKKSRFKGITMDSDTSCRAKIQVANQAIFLGTYQLPEEEEDAARVYDAAWYMRYGGRKDVPNFPLEYEGLSTKQGTEKAEQVLGGVRPGLLEELRAALASKGHKKTSAFEGVDSHLGKWRAQLHIAWHVQLGRFPADRTGEEEAARAYDAACYLRDGGKSDVPNFPLEYQGLSTAQGIEKAERLLGPAVVEAVAQAVRAREERRQIKTKAQKKSRFTGLRLDRTRWAATIRIAHRDIILGFFGLEEDQEEAAARVFDAACYLRDGGRKDVPNFTLEYKGLSKEQGVARAKALLDPLRPGLLEELTAALESREEAKRRKAAGRKAL